jgi:hypothetical protein
MGPNTDAQIGQRPVSEEPMYLIVNLGISENFGAVDYDGLMSLWPVTWVLVIHSVLSEKTNRRM